MSSVCKNVFEAILRYGHDEDFDPIADRQFIPTDAPLARLRRSKFFVAVLRRANPFGMTMTELITAV